MAGVPQGPSERAQALAKRFGMTPEAVEELFVATHAEYPPSSPPVEPASDKPAIETAAKVLPASAMPEVPTTPPRPNAPKGLSGGLLAAIFLVLLLGLIVSLSFHKGCFARRTIQSARQVDTMATKHTTLGATAPSAPATEVPPVIPPVNHPADAHSRTDLSRARPNRKPVPRPVFVTTSNFAAEEELGKLHAAGNRNAYMQAVRTRTGVSFRIYANR